MSPQSNAPLILASSSSYRRMLLERLKLPFTCHVPDIDETPLPNETPLATCQRLAIDKALAVAQHHPNAVVIGSDQVADLHGLALSKPGNLDNARNQLLALRGQTVTFYSAVCLAQNNTVLQTFYVPTLVEYRHFSNEEIARYLNQEPAFDCAGSAKCEGLGITLVQSIHSHDPTALIGLPLIQVAQALRTFGIATP
jgi:septum formation protein